MLNDYKEMLSALREAGAEFLVIGAHALASHGIIRASYDFDIWVRPTPENAQRVWRALAAFGTPLQQVTLDDFTRPKLIFQIGVAPNCIHLMTSISGVDFETAWQNRVESTVPELNVSAPVIGRRELIINKRAAARPKDLLDADDLEAGRMR